MAEPADPESNEKELLERIVESCSTPEQIAEIEAAVNDSSVPLDNFLKVVPEEIISLIWVVRNPAQYEILKQELDQQDIPLLEEAKECVDRHLHGVLSHPAFFAYVEQASSNDEEEGEELSGQSGNDPLNRIASLNYMPTWLGTPPKMTPAIHLIVEGLYSQNLLNSTLEWDRVLFLCSGITEFLASEMSESTKLKDFCSFDRDEFSKWMQNLQSNLEIIQKKAPEYGIDLTEQSEEE